MSLGKQNSKLMINNNPLAKTKYLDSQRMELNQVKKDNLKLIDEIKSFKRKEEKVAKRLQGLWDTVMKQFGSNLCKVLDIPDNEKEVLLNLIKQQTS